MSEKLIANWKKVFESDLSYIVFELKELIKVPAVIFLDGEMGAGKTTFAKSFIIDGETSSPSYSLLTETKSCLHADLDRVESREDIIHLEIGLHLENKSYFLVEWGIKHKSALMKEIPENFSFYHLKIDESSSENLDSPKYRNYSFFEILE